MRSSWVTRRYTFYALCFILFILHLGSLLLHLKSSPPKDSVTQTKPMKVKITKVPKHKFKKQIVQSEDSEFHEKKDNAFLSDKDRSVDRESVARKVDIFKDGSKSAGAKSSQGRPKKDISLSELGTNSVEDNPFKKAAEEYAKAKNGEGTQVAQMQEVSSTNDYIEDVPLGDVTHLNTTEYKYYGFYHRVRQKLEQFWGRSIQEKAEQLASEGRMVASSENLITSLEITLDEMGEILAIKVTGTSGVKELDDAAIESFNEAGPFPNPPEGMVQNGTVTLEWGFVVST